MDNRTKIVVMCLAHFLVSSIVATVTILLISEYQNPTTFSQECFKRKSNPVSEYKDSATFSQECFKRQSNPEKFPSLYYSIIQNMSFVHFQRIVFNLKLPPKLDFTSRLVAASDAIQHISMSPKFYEYPYNISITYGRATSRNVTYFNCFESSVILNEIIQMNIEPMLHEGLVTIIITKINKKD